MRIGFIGAGKVGYSLGKFFVDGNIHVTGYYSKHIESAIDAAKFTGTKAYDDITELIKQSDAIFITVPDGKISEVYQEIKEEIEGKQICHCSGAMTAAEAFPGLREHGAYGYSIHPLFPVSSKYEAYKELVGAFFCIEGDDEHLCDWQARIESLGARCRTIEAGNKAKYHAACAIASNLVVGLIAESLELLGECGFAPDDALAALRPLAISNMNRIFAVGAVDALTGPVERNDVETVAKHLDVLEKNSDREAYRAVTERLIEVAEEKHPTYQYTELREIVRRN